MALAGIGSLLILIGAVWLVVISVQTGQTTGEKILWGAVNFLCQPLGGIIFYIVKRQGLVPLLLVIVGVVLAGIGNYSLMSELQRQAR